MTDKADAPLPLAGPARHCFLSPHYDDIALSCGGTVARLARAGRVPEIRVAFGSEPEADQPLTPFALAVHGRWELDAANVITRRRQEEASAASVLGATSTCLRFCDAIYRNRLYQSEAELFGEVAAMESTLAHELTSDLLATIGDDTDVRIYAPLGIGRHVDHQICFATGVELAAAGWEVWFYEDLPYALRPNARDDRMRGIAAGWEETAPAPLRPARLRPMARIDIGPDWETKLTAIHAYASQLPAIFRDIAPGGVTAIDAALRDYALRRGDGVPAEQWWHLAEPVTVPKD